MTAVLRGLTLGLMVFLAGAAAASAWNGKTHRQVAEVAATRLPGDLPAFLRTAGPALGRAAIDPDVWRNEATSALRAATRADHYFDLERVETAVWPERRHTYLARLGTAGHDAGWTGTLPLAIAEHSDRLALALAEYRCWPDDAAIRARVIETAGVLAHFAADLQQPLHTSIHHDGRARPDGSSPGDGSHVWSDRLIEWAIDDPHRVARRVEPLQIVDVATATRTQLEASHAKLDRAYTAVALAREAERGRAPRELRRYAEERLRAAVAFVAGLWIEAWQRSERIELPGWLPAARGEAARPACSSFSPARD